MSDETPKLRLRPKLAGDSAVPPQPTVVTAPPPAPEISSDAPAPASPRATDAPSPPPAAPAVRFKPRVPAPPTEAPPGPAAIAAVVADPVAVPAPVPPPAAVAAAVPPPLPLPAAAQAPTATPATSRSAKKVQLTALGIGLAGALVFSLVAFLALQKTRVLTEQIAAEEAAERAAPPKQNRPSIDKNEATAIAESAAPAPAPKKSAPLNTAPVPAPAPAPVPATSASTPAVAATAPQPVAGTPSTEAQDWVNKLKISGVRAGASPKVLIAGKSFSVGDAVNPALGLVFAGYDPARDFVMFKDAAGTVYERRVR